MAELAHDVASMTSRKAHSAYLPETRSRREAPARERIITVATRLFYRQGIRGVGINTVIAESDVAKTTLYEHFRSKDELVAECLHRLDQRYFSWFVTEVERRAESPIDRLLAMFDIYDEWFQSPDFRGCAFINAAVELADSEHPASTAIANHKRRSRELIEQLAEDAGFVNAKVLSDHLTLLMEGAIITALVEHDWRSARRAHDAAVRLLELETRTAPPPLRSASRRQDPASVRRQRPRHQPGHGRNP